MEYNNLNGENNRPKSKRQVELDTLRGNMLLKLVSKVFGVAVPIVTLWGLYNFLMGPYIETNYPIPYQPTNQHPEPRTQPASHPEPSQPTTQPPNPPTTQPSSHKGGGECFLPFQMA